ncbi:MAG: LacI family transcriptional regulator [Oscillospiraceae bacterium]|nr:LacI family transcriptional regulator [Oscillospiraceae bacterium]
MTIKDIANIAKVSTATVSYVINGTKPVMPEKRQRVLDAIAQTGYQPNQMAKSLRTKKSNNIGVLVEDIMGFSTSSIIDGISKHVEHSDYNILLNDLRLLDSLLNQYDQIVQQKDKINKALSLLRFGARVDAVIYVGMFDRDISGIITDIGKPIVIAYSTANDSHTCSVTYENETISAEAMRYLIDCGHKRIAVITGLAHTAPAQMRMQGILEAVKEAGLVLDSAVVKNGDWERESGYFCMKDLLEQEKDNLPTAVIAMNDLMAIGAMDAIREAGLQVPQDISVMGFDNREISTFVWPKLTTAEIDLKGIGFTAAQMAIAQMGGNEKARQEQHVVLPSRLIIRDTVANI